MTFISLLHAKLDLSRTICSRPTITSVQYPARIRNLHGAASLILPVARLETDSIAYTAATGLVDANALPRVELDYIQRPDSSDIDVRGKGYYVERGVVYKKNGTPIHVSKTGLIYLTGAMGKQERVGLGWVLFAAYPDFYGYKHGIHTQMDHINGISTDNEAWNFRPMTIHQNAAVRHRTGFTIPPPITQTRRTNDSRANTRN